MKALRWALCAGLLFTSSLALAADIKNPDIDVAAWNVRLEDTKRLCAIDSASGECALAAISVQSDLARALTAISYAADRDRMRPLVRRVLDLNPPGLQTAAAYALARLGPEPSDTPRLLALLNDPVPTVRRAAWGALKASTDPAVREWVERAKFQGTGDRFVDDRRPVDAVSLGVQPPPGTQPIWFEMKAWSDGAQVFTAEGTPEDVLAHFEKIAGSPIRPLAEVQAWFASDEAATKALARFANTAWFENARVVALSDGTGDNAGKPVRLAIVWQDVQFGKTGFALQWLPGSELESALGRPWSGEFLPQTLPDTSEGEISARVPFEKPNADRLDTAAFMAVVMADGTGAETYLAMFPNGAYRAEVEALKAQPRLEPINEDMVEPTEVKIRFANIPTDQILRVDVVPVANPQFAEASEDVPQPDNWVEVPVGQSEGELSWKSDEPLRPGLYEIRGFVGPDEMEFDSWSMRKALPGSEPIYFRTIRISPRIVKLATDKSSYAPNEPVQITYADMPAAYSPGVGSPFLTIVKAGAPAKDWQQYVYTRDVTAGTQTLSAPSTPGAYEVRALFAEDGIVHGVAEITVVDGAAPAPTPTPSAVGEPTPGADPTPEPAPPVNDANITITLAKPSFAPNEPIIVTVTGLPGDPHDWIAVVPAAAEDRTSGLWVYSGGVQEGTFTLPGMAAGSYEIRVRFKDEYVPVHARLAFEVK